MEMFVPNTDLQSSKTTATKTTDKPNENDWKENNFVFETTPTTPIQPEVLNSILPTKPLEDTLKAMTPFEFATKRSSEVKKLIFIMPNLFLIMPNSECQLS